MQSTSSHRNSCSDQHLTSTFGQALGVLVDQCCAPVLVFMSSPTSTRRMHCPTLGRTRSLGVGELADVAAQVEGCQDAGRAPGPLRQDKFCAHLQTHAQGCKLTSHTYHRSGEFHCCLNAGRLGNAPRRPLRATCTLCSSKTEHVADAQCMASELQRKKGLKFSRHKPFSDSNHGKRT